MSFFIVQQSISMNFKVFLLIFVLPIFLSKYPSIFTDISDISVNPSTDISVITDILFLALGYVQFFPDRHGKKTWSRGIPWDKHGRV